MDLTIPELEELPRLVHLVAEGQPTERGAAVASLARLPLSCVDVQLLLGLLKGQTGGVQEHILAAVSSAFRNGSQPGIEDARRTAVTAVLAHLPHFEGQAAAMAGKVVAELVKHDPKLKENCRELAGGLAAAGLTTYALPTGNDIESLVLAARRSRAARRRLREEQPDLLEHRLVRRLKELADPIQPATVEDARALFVQLEGLNFGSYDQNRELARDVRAVMDRLNVRLRCPHCPEGTPPEQRESRLAFFARKDTTSGTFAFDHGRRGKTRFHSGTARLPRLELFERSVE